MTGALKRPGALLTMLLAGAGCMSYGFPAAQRLYLAGRYADIERYVEAKRAEGKPINLEELSCLCGAYWKLQKYDKLIPCSEEMAQRVRAHPTNVVKRSWLSWDIAYAFMWGTAFGYLELGQYDQAIAEATRAYQFGLDQQLDPFHQAYSLSALALAHALKGDRVNAVKFAKLLDEVETSHYKYQGLELEKRVNLAKIYIALGDYEQALAVMQRSETTATIGYNVASNLFFGKPLTGFGAYHDLPQAFMSSKALLETGHLEEAKRGYDALLGEHRASENRDLYWIALFDRGRIAEREGQLEEAIRYDERAVSVIEEARATLSTEATKIGYVGDKQAVYHHVIAALIARGHDGKAFEYVERSRSRALVDLLASRKEFAIHAGDQQEIQAILRRLEALEAEGQFQGASPERGSHAAQVDELRSASPELASLVTVTAVSVPALQRSLSLEETLVEYYAAGQALYAFVMTRDRLSAVRLDGVELPSRVQAFRDAVEDPRSERHRELARQLFAQLIEPIEPLAQTPHLLIVPHGALHYVPFGALYDGTRHLIDRYSLRYLPSASVMEYLKPPAASAAARVMVIGNPEREERAPLVYAEQEAEMVARMFPGSTVLLRAHATETAFKHLSRHFSRLHLATHGVFNAASPLTSGLLLTGDPQNDGLLTVGELYSLTLEADLVTLSACETGLSKISNGDELVGLARGFLYAGSRSIVASLWSVDDEATAYLMSAFYQHLHHTPVREALRAAQQDTRTQYPHPFYWAAFQVIGQG